MITVAPWSARARAVSKPMPLLAPVTITIFPLWSGIFSVVQIFLLIFSQHFVQFLFARFPGQSYQPRPQMVLLQVQTSEVVQT